MTHIPSRSSSLCRKSLTNTSKWLTTIRPPKSSTTTSKMTMKAKKMETVSKKKTRMRRESMATKNQRKKMENFPVMNLLMGMKKMKALFLMIPSGSKIKARIQPRTSHREPSKRITNKVRPSLKSNKMMLTQNLVPISLTCS